MAALLAPGVPPMLSQGHTHPPPPPGSSISGDDIHKSESDSGGPALNIGVFKEIAKRALVDALNSVNGAKTLVLERSLAGPLGLLTEVSLLKHHGVDKMFWLESGPLNASTTNVVYLCRPQVKYMMIISEQIKRLTAEHATHTYNLFLVPRRTTLCERILKEEGVFGEVNIASYKLEFIPVEDDLLSLEWEDTFREIFLDGDETAIYYAAQALITFQQAYGLFPRIIGKGDAAKKLANLIIHLRPPRLATVSVALDSLIIIDRSTDMITPLLTQLTYQGLIDEFIGIRNSHIEVDPSYLSNAPPAPPTGTPTPSTSTSAPVITPANPKKKKHLLTASGDTLFNALRDLNFAVVGNRLNREAKRLDAEYKGRHQAQTVAQLREFVGKLGGLQNEHQALRLHTSLSEQIHPLTRTEQFNKSLEIQQNLLASYEPAAQLNAIEDLIAQQAPVQLVLRLMCVASLTSGGIKVKVLENLKREILQTYGYSHLPTLLNLTSLSLITALPLPKIPLYPPPPPFAAIRKHLRLLSDTPENAPTDVSFVYSGYAPISSRLIQCVTQKGAVLASVGPADDAAAAGGAGRAERTVAHPISGWKGFEDALKLIPGETVDVIQKGDEGESPLGTLAPPPPRDRATTTMVFFLGGCTYTEIATIRWMAKQTKGRRYLIATTGIINGSTLIESLAPKGAKFEPVA